MSTLSGDQINYTKYRWEFLRRKKEYIDDWEKLQAEIKKKYGKWQPGKHELKLPPEEREFCRKWRIGMALSPYASYDGGTTEIMRKFEPSSESKETTISTESPHDLPVNQADFIFSTLPIDLHRWMFNILIQRHTKLIFH